MKKDEGTIGLLGLGLAVCAGMMICGGVSVGAAELARVDVLEAADHASAAAADRLALASVYTNGVDEASLDGGLARDAATSSLASTPLPNHVKSWQVVSVTVTAKEVSVFISAQVDPPVVGSALRTLGEPITVRVTSHAQGHVVHG